jgi:uncharacterized RDD family membrane protein YckC
MLIDGLIQSGPMMLLYLALMGLAITDPNGENEAAIIPVVIGLLLAYGWGVGWWIFDRVIRQGRTGQSVGKRVMKIRLVSEHTWQPIGAGTSVGREFAHLLDAYSLYIGYLWPLWDAKRQTFADKVCSTIVLRDR